MTDLLVVGGGVMGLMTAWEAARAGATVRVLERGRVGDPMTASYGRTRSYRSDYLDADYVRLAREAMRLWDGFEARTGTRALVRCGCMNVATAAVTPDLDATYALQARTVTDAVGVHTESLDRAGLQARFPDLDADVAVLEPDAGVVDQRAVAATLRRELDALGVAVHEGVTVTAITAGVAQTADGGRFGHDRLVVCAGHGTNDVLSRLDGCDLSVPLTRDRPSEARYVTPPEASRDRFLADALPVIAYLDTGIYVHPIVPGVCDRVKIGYYHPPDLKRARTGVDSVADFVDRCLPGLAGAPMEDVTDTDGCDYDLVADDDFVLGPVPGVPHAFVGVGWRGTGYKFAPWVGQALAGLAAGADPTHDLRRFDPARFTEEAHDDPIPATAAR